MAKRLYDDECGGEFSVNVKRWPTADSKCDHNKLAFKVSVSDRRRTLWAPKWPMCVPDRAGPRKSEDSLARTALDFFSHERCRYGRVKQGPLKTTGTFEGARRRRKGRR